MRTVRQWKLGSTSGTRKGSPSDLVIHFRARPREYRRSTHLELVQLRCLLDLEEDLVSICRHNLDVKSVVFPSAITLRQPSSPLFQDGIVLWLLTIGLGLLLGSRGTGFRHVDTIWVVKVSLERVVR
jgi:hypothetical protein